MVVTHYHILVAFVISVRVRDLLTSATDVTIASEAISPFTAVKTVSNDSACYFGLGLTSTIAMSAAQCSLECNQLTSCRGFNLIDNDSKCAMVIADDSQAMTYGVQQGCRFFIRGLGILPLENTYGTNVALNKTAIQRSTWDTWSASFAVDGNLSTLSGTGLSGTPQWWAVDLGQPQHINVVQVSGDIASAHRLDNLYVWLSNTQPTVGQALDTAQCILCYQFSGSIPAGSQPIVPCPKGLSSFRYVILQSTYWNDAICFREVQVFISEGTVNKPGTNVALNKPAIQYTTWDSWSASFAVDGNLSTLSGTGAGSMPQWWAVDLAQPEQIKFVQISGDNSTSYPNRLDNLYVWLSNTRPTVGLGLDIDQCTLCYQFSGSILVGSQPIAPCPIGLSSFRHVILQSSRTNDAICFREVQVFIN